MSIVDGSPQESSDRSLRRAVGVDLLLLSLLVFGGYFARLGHLPILGEEGRRGLAAVDMIRTGDWVVVRQGGLVYPDRPPMSNWLIALTGLARGAVDPVAVRLPSVLAILALTLLLYAYFLLTRRARLPAVAAAAAFATFGQVLELGRRGESEAVFTLFVAGSLLVWHAAYARRLPPALTWCAAYTLVACGALTKGLQGPIYFGAVIGVFLIRRGEWRRLFTAAHGFGIALFAGIVAAWQVPYLRATDWPSVHATWFDVVGPRVGWQGLVEHLLLYPVDTFACLLPWSAALLLLVSRSVRGGLDRGSSVLEFAVTALVVTYPSVWFSRGAETRYYLPLYPIAAVVVALVVDRLAGAADGSFADRSRRRFAGVLTAAAAVGGALAVAPWLAPASRLGALRPGPIWTLGLVALAGVAAWACRAAARPGRDPMRRAVISLALLLALLYNGLWVTAWAARRSALAPRVAAAKAHVPGATEVVSLGPIDARFAYYYLDAVPEIPWPERLDDLPDEVDYFLFEMMRGDTAQRRQVWRGMQTWTTSGTLPFRWTELARVDVGRKIAVPPYAEVILGRVVRDADGRPVETGSATVKGSEAPSPTGSEPRLESSTK